MNITGQFYYSSVSFLSFLASLTARQFMHCSFVSLWWSYKLIIYPVIISLLNISRFFNAHNFNLVKAAILSCILFRAPPPNPHPFLASGAHCISSHLPNMEPVLNTTEPNEHTESNYLNLAVNTTALVITTFHSLWASYRFNQVLEKADNTLLGYCHTLWIERKSYRELKSIESLNL